MKVPNSDSLIIAYYAFSERIAKSGLHLLLQLYQRKCFASVSLFFMEILPSGGQDVIPHGEHHVQYISAGNSSKKNPPILGGLTGFHN